VLPTVVIGADSSVRGMFERWHRDTHSPAVLFFPNVEDATYSLADQLADKGPVAQDGDQWCCSVVYGPEAWGPIVTAQRATIPHTGWTIIAAAHVGGDDQARPRRVRDHRVEGKLPETMMLEAMAKVQAQFLLDAGKADGDGSLVKLASLLESRPTP
jgi:hypothetical protein